MSHISRRIKGLPRREFVAWIGVLALLAGNGVLLWGLPVEVADFYDFYLASDALMRGGDPYAPQPNGLQGFFNPLWAVFPALPLAAVGASAALWVWQLLSLLLLVASVLPLVRVYQVRMSPALFLLVGWLFLIPWFVGQNAPLVAAGAFLAVTFAARGRWALAGAMAPLLMMKPHTVLLFPLLLLIGGRRRLLAGGLVSGAAAAGASFLLMPSWSLSWLRSQWGESQSGGGARWPASALLNALDYLNWPQWLYLVMVALALALLWWRRRDPWLAQSALALALGLVIAPYMRAGDFPLLIPAFLTLPTLWRNVLLVPTMGIFFLGTPIP
ncbi:MAG: glycosyltransferase 87 family protein, partial [Ardenticatenaceae bacterium]